jgi:hypothetical protein
MKKAASRDGSTPSQLIANRTAELGGWRGEMLARLRKVILEATPEIAEKWQWDTAVWTHNGLVCSVGAFKAHVKLNFFRGASLIDPKGLFNAGLDAKITPAVDFREGDRLDAPALRSLVRAAAALNASVGKK